jgi:hypothetical protein
MAGRANSGTVFNINLFEVFTSNVLAKDPEARVRFLALPEKKVVGLERGPPAS